MASKSEGQTYAGQENVHPMAIGAQNSGAQNLKDVPDFLSSHIWPCKNKKLIDLQVFRRIGKTMKKLYKFQIQPQTPAYL